MFFLACALVLNGLGATLRGQITDDAVLAADKAFTQARLAGRVLAEESLLDNATEVGPDEARRAMVGLERDRRALHQMARARLVLPICCCALGTNAPLTGTFREFRKRVAERLIPLAGVVLDVEEEHGGLRDHIVLVCEPRAGCPDSEKSHAAW